MKLKFKQPFLMNKKTSKVVEYTTFKVQYTKLTVLNVPWVLSQRVCVFVLSTYDCLEAGYRVSHSKRNKFVRMGVVKNTDKTKIELFFISMLKVTLICAVLLKSK